MRPGWLWLALVVALSPLLADLARHWLEHPWASSSALFAALCVRQFASDSTPGPTRPRDALWLAPALLGALVTVGGGMPRFGRPAIPLAAIGLAGWLGRPRGASAVLALWIVPVPSALQDAAEPLLQAGLRAIGLFGGTAFSEPQDAGWPLVWLAAGLGYYAALRAGSSLRPALGRAIIAGAFALPLQLAALVVAHWAVSAGHVDAARWALDLGVPWATAIVALTAIEIRSGSARSVDSFA